LGRASELIRDAFQLDQVGVYLLDASGKVAVLKSNVGRAVPAHEHQLHVDDPHRVSRAISQRVPRQWAARWRYQFWSILQLVLLLALGTRTIGALRFDEP
jgi:hypothetical protein